LFELLEAVRGERRGLKNRLKKMDKIKTVAVQLDKENQRLFSYVFMLSTVCVALLVALLIIWVRL
jgi:N-glycosylase/DNA lyase